MGVRRADPCHVTGGSAVGSALWATLPNAVQGSGKRLARLRRQLARQALGVAGRAELREQTVRLAELSRALLLVAVLARQLGELDVELRLEAAHAGFASQLARPFERRLDLLACGEALRCQQDPGEDHVRDRLRRLPATAHKRNSVAE